VKVEISEAEIKALKEILSLFDGRRLDADWGLAEKWNLAWDFYVRAKKAIKDKEP